jgi:hypothetical protein
MNLIFETVGRILNSEAITFKHFLEPIVCERKVGSMTSRVVQTL